MKKILIIFVLVFIITGCGENKENTTKIYDDYGRDVLPGEAEYYYTFTGESTHFTFDDGMADYRDDKAEFWIKGLNVKNEENFTATISIYFNDKQFSSNYINNELLDSDKLIATYGKKIVRDEDGNMYGEIDAFMETRPENFEDAIKIVANYCDSKNNCSDETFTLNVEKHE